MHDRGVFAADEGHMSIVRKCQTLASKSLVSGTEEDYAKVEVVLKDAKYPVLIPNEPFYKENNPF